LKCYDRNNTMGVSVKKCPSNVKECLKFTCDRNVSTTIKTCNDPSDSIKSVHVLNESCISAGGKAVWYLCSLNRCNHATTTNIALYSATGIALPVI
ncbi:hypothetical protein Tcan_00395, partial [Toxocara canis]